MAENRRIVLASRPNGEPKPSDFRLETAPAPQPKEGEVLLRTRWLSLDPYMRGRMSAAKSYAKPVEIGDVHGGRHGRARSSSRRTRASRPATSCSAGSGWQDYARVGRPGPAQARSLASAPVQTALGILGMPGMTAYTGLLNIGQPKAGETLVVAAATGPVGSAVGQIAKMKGCRAVGIAGGPEKCRLLTEEFGFDAAIDHRAPDFADQLAKACPDGIDIYFENVGGAVWDAVFPLLNDFARVPVCGIVSHYNDTDLPAGPDRTPQLMGAVLRKRLTLRGFIVWDFADQAKDFARDMGELGPGRAASATARTWSTGSRRRRRPSWAS